MDNFHWRNKVKGTYKSACKDCTKMSDAESYASGNRKGATREQAAAIKTRNRKYIYDILTKSKCADCGETDVRVLEFDHLGNKEYGISQMTNYSIERLQKEIDKCEIVCANHHRIRTYSRMNKCWRTAGYPSG